MSHVQQKLVQDSIRASILAMKYLSFLRCRYHHPSDLSMVGKLAMGRDELPACRVMMHNANNPTSYTYSARRWRQRIFVSQMLSASVADVQL